MRGLRPIGFVVAALAFLPLAAAADDKDDALKLAQRVASRGGFIDAVVTLHAPPKNLPASVPLPGATLLGSVVETVRQGSFVMSGSRVVGASNTTVTSPTMLYYDAPAGRDAAVSAYEAALQQAGWKPAPDIRRRLPIPQGGFQMNPFPAVKQWCSPDAKTAISIVNASDTAFDLTLLSAGRTVDLQCSDAPSPFDAVMPRSPLPTFSAPSGITITSSGPASDGSTTGARIESKLGLPAVFEAFAKQLRDAGWAPGTSTSAATTRTQTFSKTVDGTPYVTLLAVYALDPTHYVALADVSNSAP